MERGTTLLELAVGLSLLALVLVIALPKVGRGLDRMACLAARDALIARAEVARAEATRSGSAAVVIDPDSARVWVEVAGRARDTVDLALAFGVQVQHPVGPRLVRLPFDRLGIGRFASATVVVARGSEQAALSVSSYGRLAR
ncbi:MAG: hypothetical protein R3E10_16970 [Gemmatimonadota bacterium]